MERLLERVPAESIGVSVRDPGKAAGWEARGVRVRWGDFTDTASLRDAFEGASQVLIVSSNARASGGDTLAQHRNAIDAAKAVGAERIVYTSHMGASPDPAFPPMWDHAATEAMLTESGITWTALRRGFYAESGLMLMGDALASGVVAAPEDGKVSWTARADLAEADAAIVAGSAAGRGARHYPYTFGTGDELIETNKGRGRSFLSRRRSRPRRRSRWRPATGCASSRPSRGSSPDMTQPSTDRVFAARSGQVMACSRAITIENTRRRWPATQE